MKNIKQEKFKETNNSTVMVVEKKNLSVSTIVTLVMSALILLACLMPVITTIDGKDTMMISALVMLGEDGIIGNSLSFLTSALGEGYELYATLLNLSVYFLLAGATISLIYSIVTLLTTKFDKIKRIVFFILYLSFTVGIIAPVLSLMFTVILGGITSQGFDVSAIFQTLKYCYPCLIWAICGIALSNGYRKKIFKRKNKSKFI